VIARLRPNASVIQLNAQMQTIVARLIDRLPARADYMRSAGFSGAATPMRDELIGDVRSPIVLLQAGVVIVLLIACANVEAPSLGGARHRFVTQTSQLSCRADRACPATMTFILGTQRLS
jgi:hypothetical protein